jgi:Domain of unknown function (DU1801)
MAVDEAVRAYVERIEPRHRALFERLHGIAMAAHPEADVTLAYGMPAYRVGKRRLSLGAWEHGVSVYGWRKDNDGGFVARHPALAHGKGTLRISPADADSLGDDELSALLGGALEP